MPIWRLHGSIAKHWRYVQVAVFAATPSAEALAEVAAQPTPSSPVFNATVIAAIVALVGVIISTAVSMFTARYTARNTIRSEYAKRQSELALKIAEMVSADDKNHRQAAMRRFALAIVKVVAPKDHDQTGRVYFIPMNSRVTVGRSDDNDIVLKDDSLPDGVRAPENEYWLSRWHCGFVADQHSVWIEDYKSLNGTQLGKDQIAEPRQLKDGDEIEIGPYKLHFRTIRENTILSQ